MNDPLIVTMAGPNDLDLRRLSNMEAGLVILSQVTRAHPGITWGQLANLAGRPELMGGWLTDLSHKVASVSRGATSSVADVGRGAGGVVMDVTRSGNSLIGDAFDATGDKIADAVRVFTSKKVIDGLNSSYSSFSQSGGITGAIGGGLFNSGAGGGDAAGADGQQSGSMGGIWDFIVNLGAGAKAKLSAASASDAGGIPGGPLPWVLAGGVVLVLMLRRRG